MATLRGTANDDLLFSQILGPYYDYIYGYGGNDLIWGGNLSDHLYGGNGSDDIYGNSGSDYLFGDHGNDRLYGGSENDTLYGGTGADVLDGGDGQDTASYVYAYSGISIDYNPLTRRLEGASGEATGDTFSSIEILRGSNYNDIFSGVGGNVSHFIGGYGIDTIDYAHSYGGVSVNLYNGTGQYADATGDFYNGIENVSGSRFSDILLGNNGNNILRGKDGSDNLQGGAGNDFLYGGIGNDRLNGGAGADILDGDEGQDTVTYEQSFQGISIYNSGGKLVGAGGDAQGDTLSGIEIIIGSYQNDTFTGVDENLYFFNGSSGIDTITYSNSFDAVNVNITNGQQGVGGDAQGDVYYNLEGVIGSYYDDNLTGNALDNTINGRTGDDILTGGGGSDTFVFALSGNGHDTITDFEVGLDTIRVSYGNRPVNFLYDISGNSEETVLTFGDSIITLEGVDVEDFSYGDIIF